MIASSQGRRLAASAGLALAVWLLRGAAAATPEIVVFDSRNTGLPADQVTAIAVAPDRTVWLGVEGHGLVHFIDPRWEPVVVKSARGRDATRIRGIEMAPGGAAWVGTARGLARIDGSDDWFFEDADGLPGNYISALYVDSGNDTVWVGTEHGVGEFHAEPWAPVESAGAPAPVERVTAIAGEQDGTLWVGTLHGLLFRRDGVWQVANGPLPGRQITALAVSPGGTLWVGTLNGLARFEDGAWTVYHAADGGLPADHVTALLPDADGAVWIGTESGLSRLSGEQWEVLPVPAKGLLHRAITAISRRGGDGLWVGTSHGVYVLKQPGSS